MAENSNSSITEKLKSQHQFGNFHSYYHFHPSEERLKLIPEKFFHSVWLESGSPKYFVLFDIGCNDGNLTIGLYERACKELEHLGCTCYMLGVDIDEELIISANKQYNETYKNVTFQVANIVVEDIKTSPTINNYLQSIQRSRFHFISVFSVTMWIHLNYGDKGLRHVLEMATYWTESNTNAITTNSNNIDDNVHNSDENNYADNNNNNNSSSGCVLIEPQPWKCYKAAMKRCRKLGLPTFPYGFNNLEIIHHIEDDIKHIMLNTFHMKEKLFMGIEIWGRSLMLFSKNGSNSSSSSSSSSSSVTLMSSSHESTSSYHQLDDEVTDGTTEKKIEDEIATKKMKLL